MKAFLLILFCILSVEVASAQVQYGLAWDPRYAAPAGAENLISLHRASFWLEDRLLKARWSDETTWQGKLLGVTYRTAKGWLLDFAFDHTLALVQHEVFGHGARVRELNLEVERYAFSLPPPYSSGHGFTFWRGRPREVVGDALIRLAGVDAAALLGSYVRDRALNRGYVHYREALLSLIASHHITHYVLRTHEERAESSNDIMNYLHDLQLLSGMLEGRDGPQVTLAGLKRNVLFNLLDPFQMLGLYTLVVQHLWNGEVYQKVPGIAIWRMRYFPALRFGITPFGPEHLFENILVYRGSLGKINGRRGYGPRGSFWGGGIEVQPLLIQDRYAMGLRLDMWRQPSRSVEGGRPQTLGWSARARGRRQAGIERFRFNVVGEIGYKTEGFLPGEIFDAGVYGMVGLSLTEPHR